MTFKTINPTTEKFLWDFKPATQSQIELCLTNAVKAQISWQELSLKARAKVLHKAANILRKEEIRFAKMITLEMGKPILESIGEIRKCAWVCDHYAEFGEKYLVGREVKTDATRSFIQYDPLGTILAIMPWNFPFWQVFRFAAPTLMAGNSAILKHAPNVPRCAEMCVEIFAEACGDPRLFQNLRASLEDIPRIIKDDRIQAVSLTGSERAGSAVGAIAGSVIKPALLELGGSDPFIVLDDADIDKAVNGAISGRYLNAGQSCIAAKRFFIHDDIYDSFLSKVTEKVRALIVGDPTRQTTQIGPMARRDLLEELDRQVTESVNAGAKIIVGGSPLKQEGWFYPPTIVTNVRPGMPLFEEEIFGPVMAIISYRNIAQAIELANQTRFGLGGSIWTASPQRIAANQIKAGSVFYNSIVKSDPRLPFGGIRRSGIGRELGREGILAFVNTKTVYLA